MKCTVARHKNRIPENGGRIETAGYLNGDERSAVPRPDNFPILNVCELHSLPKASRRADLARIIHSPNSEDYVTWNWACLVAQQPSSIWWASLVDLARKANAKLNLHFDSGDLPQLRLWDRVMAPADYETASRRRLRDSPNAAWRARARDPRPVEGVSEIDLSLHGRGFVIFVEAKLGADISLRTTYDPRRDQISRNIDCLLECAAGRRPYFWIFARDTSASRAYVRLIGEFQQRPESLCSLLPHRDPDELRRVAQNSAILLWRDLIQILPQNSGDELARMVMGELARRA